MNYFTLTLTRLSLIILFFFLGTSCSRTSCATLLPGDWKMERIEVRAHDSVRKLISCQRQYWKVIADDSLKIFDSGFLRKTLKVQISDQRMRSYDDQGAQAEEYSIRSIGGHQVQLSVHQTVDNITYSILYILSRNEELALR